MYLIKDHSNVFNKRSAKYKNKQIFSNIWRESMTASYNFASSTFRRQKKFILMQLTLVC